MTHKRTDFTALCGLDEQIAGEQLVIIEKFFNGFMAVWVTMQCAEKKLFDELDKIRITLTSKSHSF